MTRLFLQTILRVLAVCLLFAGHAWAAADSDGFRRGNALYAAGDFAGAAGAYETQVRRGEYTANLFYNLADAYYRQGDRGRAILNYQRALILDPAHAEAAANLAFVRGVKPTTLAHADWIGTTLPWLTAAAGWLAVAGLVIVVAGRRTRVAGFMLLGVGVLAAAAGVAASWPLDDSAGNATRAVVITENAPALYAPADNSKVVTNLTAGGEVRILSDQGAWVYVRLGDGTLAWIASSKIERLVPTPRATLTTPAAS